MPSVVEGSEKVTARRETLSVHEQLESDCNFVYLYSEATV